MSEYRNRLSKYETVLAKYKAVLSKYRNVLSRRRTPTANIQDLPNEILEVIFEFALPRQQYFDKPELPFFERPYDFEAVRNLAPTCRRFKSTVDDMRFRYLFAFDLVGGRRCCDSDSDSHHTSLSCLYGLYCALQENPELGQKCRVFRAHMTKPGSIEGGLSCLVGILSRLPNVTKVWIDVAHGDVSVRPRLYPWRTSFAPVLGQFKNMSRLTEIYLSPMDHLEMIKLSQAHWPPSAKKLHMAMPTFGGMVPNRKMQQNPTFKITSLSTYMVRMPTELPQLLNDWPTALEDFTISLRQVPRHYRIIPAFLQRHKASLRALRVIGGKCTWLFNLSDFTALEHLTFDSAVSRRYDADEQPVSDPTASGIFGPKLNKITWLLRSPDEGLALNPDADMGFEALAREAHRVGAALEEIHIVLVPRGASEASVSAPAPVICRQASVGKVSISYSVAELSGDQKLALLRQQVAPVPGRKRCSLHRLISSLYD
ncbi:uncharacterized protein MAM_01714 [Metarhizium album ARSEF 1941]|uniref:F-box domain-containing protein n=1 Tax=Metarhizium album (strain ARSEF 1941) TaxID=1081103 RepID=A0A0B2X6L9_METAS|nr:uncharacterized protein MAM_01714 [Metarhizium album ARSEF 1941]KHO00936.1 hypothetical protein MAM_01714 [Metarhizium album ARSEF 1941]